MDIKKISHSKILVVGDAMLDRYWVGDVTRISPEAPVPVVHVSRSEERLGGGQQMLLSILQALVHVPLCFALLAMTSPVECLSASREKRGLRLISSTIIR